MHAQVIEKLSSRSYLVKSKNGALYQHDWIHLKPVKYKFETRELDNAYNVSVPTYRKSLHIKKSPERLLYDTL